MNKLIAAIIIISLWACKKNKEVIPGTHVDEYINTQLPAYSALQVPLNYIYYPAGYKGMIIYRRSSSEFTCLERSCTFDPSKQDAVVEVMNDGFTCIDSICGSRFSINDGSVIGGPATQPLLQYHYDFDGTTLHVYN